MPRVNFPPVQSNRSRGPIDVDGHDFLARVVGLTPGVVYVFNHETQSNDYANRSIAEMLGYTADEVQAMGSELFLRIIHPDDLAASFLQLDKIAKLADGAQEMWEYRTIAQDGRLVWLRSIEAVFERGDCGRVLRHIGVAFDITAEKSSEIALRQLNAELESRVTERTEELAALNEELERRVIARTRALSDANRELEQLSYIAAHDLKAPLNNMASLVHMLDDARGLLSPDHLETLSWMQEVCDQASAKLEALVCVAQSHTSWSGPFRKVSLDEILERVLLSLHAQILEAEASVTSEFDASDVFFLPEEVENILQALLSNSLKFRASARRPIIHLQSRQEEQGVCITVQDNGRGIDMSRDETKVFSLFQKAHPDMEGAGATLYSIRRIMDRIGGEITVCGEPDNGCVFRLHFPNKQQGAEQ